MKRPPLFLVLLTLALALLPSCTKLYPRKWTQWI